MTTPEEFQCRLIRLLGSLAEAVLDAKADAENGKMSSVQLDLLHVPYNATLAIKIARGIETELANRRAEGPL